MSSFCIHSLTPTHPHTLTPSQVVATHPYEGEDDDELTFEKGDVIKVVPFEDAEDEVGSHPHMHNTLPSPLPSPPLPTPPPSHQEEEGWSMGVSERTSRKGMFPDNFTKRLE